MPLLLYLLNMPEYYKRFEPKDDGRRKILKEQYPEIRRYYKEIKSQRATALKFGCSRRLIGFILYPERLKALQDRYRAEKHWKKYYDRKQLTESTRKLRAKKKALGYKITKEMADKIGYHIN